ncbi:TPA: hypothetical protein JIQ06_000785 [Acinetobacter baumannii]|nr:hypothetical protein [Acinetobacter baumannii]HAV4224629.1 hypothetical protein [Acinetobacter baumannii]
MDKCREEFEKFARWYALPLDKSEDGIYRALETQSAWKSFQHQQAKVEELQEEFAEDERFLKEQIKDKDQRISNLEYQQGMDKELIQSLQSKSEKLQKQVTDLDNRATQYALDEMATAKLNGELQKRVDAALGHLDDVNFPPDYEDAWESFYKAEQALKGEG